MIHMKCQDLFSKKKKKNIYFKLLSAAVEIGALRVKVKCQAKNVFPSSVKTTVG